GKIDNGNEQTAANRRNEMAFHVLVKVALHEKSDFSVQPLCLCVSVVVFTNNSLTTEQLCGMSSRNWLRFDIPEFVIANHHIDDGQQFAHTSDNGDLLKFVSGD